MMNWLLLVILIVIMLSAAAGYRRGFVRTVLSMVFLILVMVVSGWISPYISDALKEHTQITETIRASCTEMLEETWDNSETMSGSVEGTEPTETSEAEEEQRNLLASLGLPENVLDAMLRQNDVWSGQQEQREQMVAYAADYLTDLAVGAIVFLVSFLLAWILVRILMRIADAFAELPVIGFVNRIGGGLVGILRALLWVWIFFIVLMLFSSTGWGKVCMEEVREDVFLQFLYDNNLILRILLYVF